MDLKYKCGGNGFVFSVSLDHRMYTTFAYVILYFTKDDET